MILGRLFSAAQFCNFFAHQHISDTGAIKINLSIHEITFIGEKQYSKYKTVAKTMWSIEVRMNGKTGRKLNEFAELNPRGGWRNSFRIVHFVEYLFSNYWVR